MMVSVLKSNHIVVTLLLILAVARFQEVHSLPIRESSQSRGGVEINRDEKESRKQAVRPRRDIGLVGLNETAAGVIYHVNERKCIDNTLTIKISY